MTHKFFLLTFTNYNGPRLVSGIMFSKYVDVNYYIRYVLDVIIDKFNIF